MGIIIYALFPSHSLSLRLSSFLPFSSATAALFYFYSYAFISFLFANAYTMCLRFLCPTHPSARRGTPAETVTEPGLWQGVAVGEGEGAGDSVQRTNGKKAMLKGRE